MVGMYDDDLTGRGDVPSDGGNIGVEDVWTMLLCVPLHDSLGKSKLDPFEDVLHDAYVGYEDCARMVVYLHQ